MKVRFLVLSGAIAGASIFGPSGSANAQYPYCDPYYAAYSGCYPYAYPYPVAYNPYYYGAPIAAAAIGTGLALGAAYNWGYGPITGVMVTGVMVTGVGVIGVVVMAIGVTVIIEVT